MERIRFSISGIMGFIAIAAVGFVGLREGTEVWASLTFALTAIALLMAVPSLIYSQGAERAGWVGFTLFGWVYLVFMFSTWSGESPGIPSLPASWLLTTVHERIHAQPQYIPNPNYPGAKHPRHVHSAGRTASDLEARNDLLDGQRGALSPGRPLPPGTGVRGAGGSLVSDRLRVSCSTTASGRATTGGAKLTCQSTRLVDMLTSRFGALLRNSKWDQHVRPISTPRASVGRTVDQTDAQGDRSTLRSIRPTCARSDGATLRIDHADVSAIPGNGATF